MAFRILVYNSTYDWRTRQKMADVYLMAIGVKIVGYVNLPFLLSFSGLRSNLVLVKQLFFASVSLYSISVRSDRVDIGFSLSELS